MFDSYISLWFFVSVFLRLKGFPFTKNDIDFERSKSHTSPPYMDQYSLHHDFPLQSCGGYQYSHKNEIRVCRQNLKSNCNQISDLRSWIQVDQANENCPKVAAFDDFNFYSSVENTSGKCSNTIYTAHNLPF